MSAHRLDLHGGWSLWRWFALRGAGFPAAWLDRLAAPAAATAADRYHADPSARGDAERLLAAETERIAGAARELARVPQVREALLWQRRRAIDGVDEAPDTLGLARALQRLCVKNDTVGFYGPVGWGTLVADESAAAARPGAALLATRTMYFGHWGIDELAAKLSTNGKLLRDVAPRRMPLVRIDGNAIAIGLGARKELPPEYIRLLAACDGAHTAREIARGMATGPAAVDDETDVYDMLADLRDRKLVIWSFQIPTYTAWPERDLRALLEHTEAAPRADALATLGVLEAARDHVAAAAGSPDALPGALAAMDERFVSVLGPDAHKRAAEPGSGRMLVFEECQRDYDLRLGPKVRDRLGPALSLVLESARWYTHEVAERCRATFQRIHAALRAETGADAIEYIRFVERAAVEAAHPNGISHALVDEVAAEVQRKWAAILGADRDAHRVQRTSAELRSRVVETFAAPHAGWPLARISSVDVYAAARSAADLLAGNAQFVLGEVVPSTSLLVFPFYLRAHPDAQAVIDACLADMPAGRVAPIGPKPPNTPQDFGPVPPCDYDIEFGANRSLLSRDRVLAIADLVVVAGPDGLSVTTRDGRTRLDPIHCFEEALLSATMPRFQIVAPTGHTPRITVDDLVLVRERWQFAPSELAFARATTALDRFADARRWARDHGLPRRVFARTPEQRKQTYVDFESPLYVELLANLATGASQLTVTEMLPATDELWLADHAGQLYTSQLRLTPVDPRAYRG